MSRLPRKDEPSHIEAEITLLSGLLNHPEIILKVNEQLRPGDFYRPGHQAIAQAIFDLGDQADLVTVLGRLNELGKLEKAGGETYLRELFLRHEIGAGWRHWVTEIRRASDLRRIIYLCKDTARAALDLQPVEEILSGLKGGIRSLEESRPVDDPSNRELANAVFSRIEAGTNHALNGPRTGFENLDDHLHCLEKGSCIYVAARPGIGKTAFALNLLDNIVASHYPGRAVFFSLEMTGEAVTRRRLAARSEIFLSRLRTGRIEQAQWPDLLKAMNQLSDCPSLILDSPRFTDVDRLFSKAESLAMSGPLSVIIIDHVQRMTASKRSQSRHHELSYVAERLCSLAKTLSIPVVICSQLGRKMEERNKKRARPELGDLKESGSLEESADVVLGLHRQKVDSSLLEVEALKNRDGPSGWKAYLRFNLATQGMSDTDEVEEETQPDPQQRMEW
ncbi:MAG: AAA family ATPase [Deltaproteobacteria bacterium]|nr:AAA family ATPase [Deltaproteobacteria bacterium]